MYQIPSIENRKTVFHLLYKYPTHQKENIFTESLSETRNSPQVTPFWIWRQWQKLLMLLIKMSLTEVDRHEGKESKTKKITGQQRTRSNSISFLTTWAIWFKKAFPLETGKEGIWQF